jgi:hypothetical protein
VRLAALALVMGAVSSPVAAREAVDASAPTALSVTLYRDPARGVAQTMNREMPRGFAMITETRTVTLPPGESTIRFEGVAEGMIAVSAIVIGLPGGTIEKNRNADLLGPAALVDGTLGNRVTVTRSDPATGEERAEQAIVRTRADGGLVLQTTAGFEAVRCSGLPERLTFDRVPAGLSAQPVFSVDTRDQNGGTYTVQLTYLAWGFDWQAHYVAHFDEAGSGDDVRLRLMSWLTLLNGNGQSFADAELLVVAGRLNVVSNFEDLADSPEARALSLTCYPLGSTAAGMPVEPRAPRGRLRRAPTAGPDMIVVTGSRIERRDYNSASPIVAVAAEEQLGDLKAYRAPERVTVSAKGLKQIAFLDRDGVDGRMLYWAWCPPSNREEEAQPAAMLLTTVNDERHGLGAALPMGGFTAFEPSPRGDQLVAEGWLRDYAEGQEVEIAIGESHQVFALCSAADRAQHDEPGEWLPMHAVLTNANARPARVRVGLGWPGQWRFRGLRGTRLKDGMMVVEVVVPGNGRRELRWEAQSVERDDES